MARADSARGKRRSGSDDLGGVGFNCADADGRGLNRREERQRLVAQRLDCPPSVHQMVLTLERAGFIRRQPGVARNIEILVNPEHLPVLR